MTEVLASSTAEADLAIGARDVAHLEVRGRAVEQRLHPPERMPVAGRGLERLVVGGERVGMVAEHRQDLRTVGEQVGRRLATGGAFVEMRSASSYSRSAPR